MLKDCSSKSSQKFDIESLPDLKGKVYIVTGGNAGIGKATIIGLAAHNARVYIATRSEAKATATIAEIKKELPQADVRFLSIDLMSLESVKNAAEDFIKSESVLHGLINNAGIMAVPYAVTDDGYESQFQTNYLSHFLLTHKLLPLLTSTAQNPLKGTVVRIVNVTSDGHARFAPKDGIVFTDINLESQSPFTRYGQSKLANVLHAKYLASAYKDKNVITAAVHPGHIDTDLNRQATGAMPSLVLRAMVPLMRCFGVLDGQVKGGLSSLYAAASDGFTEKLSGAYIVPYAKIGEPSEMAMDEELARRLWEWSVSEMEGKGFL